MSPERKETEKIRGKETGKEEKEGEVLVFLFVTAPWMKHLHCNPVSHKSTPDDGNNTTRSGAGEKSIDGRTQIGQ